MRQLPDLIVIETGNPYGINGLADDLGPIDAAGCDYNCPIGNLGTAPFIPASGDMSGFLEIKVLRPFDSWFSKAYKSDYHLASNPIPTLTTGFTIHDQIPVNYYDEYYNRMDLNGAGSYAVMISINDAKHFPELSMKNNIYFFGFDYVLDVNHTPPIWNATRNDAILTLAVIRQLLHHT